MDKKYTRSAGFKAQTTNFETTGKNLCIFN